MDYFDQRDLVLRDQVFTECVGLANSSNIHFINCTFEGKTDEKPGAWVGPNCSNIYFTNCRFVQTSLDGVILVSPATFTRCVFTGCGTKKNLSSGALGAAGIYSDEPVQGIVIQECQIFGSSEFGINLVGIDTKIDSCVISQNALSGVYFRKGSKNNIMADSVVEYNGTSDTKLNPDVWRKEDLFDPDNSLTLINNMIRTRYKESWWTRTKRKLWKTLKF